MKQTVLSSYNLASGSRNVDVSLPGGPKYTLQAVWSGVSGTANGTIKLQQSLDGINFDQIKTINASSEEVDFGINIDSASGSESLEDKLGFIGDTLRIAIAVGSITGGTLSIYLNAI